MAVQHLFAGIPVADREAAVHWYERLLGRPPDLVPNDREAAWRMTETAWICLYAGAEPPAPAPHTLLVDDLDGFLDEVAGRGIVPGPVEKIAPGVRQSVLTDPEGNRLKIAQAQAQASA